MADQRTTKEPQDEEYLEAGVEHHLSEHQYQESTVESTLTVQEKMNSVILPSILVMGVTGVGKSSLISLLSNDSAKVGHSLSSSTREMEPHVYGTGGEKVQLIDTPGFDDTSRSDVEVLAQVVGFLCDMHEKRLPIIGAIYIHRITDTRMSGSSIKSMHIFRLLCGLRNAQNIVLVTSMWDDLSDYGVGKMRAREIRDKFWKEMYDAGSKDFRHNGTVESAKDILKHIMERRRPLVLKIQDQVLKRGMALKDTDLGHFLERDIRESQARHEEELAAIEKQLNKAKQKGDHEQVRELEREKQSHEMGLRRTEMKRFDLMNVLCFPSLQFGDGRADPGEPIQGHRQMGLSSALHSDGGDATRTRCGEDDEDEEIRNQQEQIVLLRRALEKEGKAERASLQSDQSGALEVECSPSQRKEEGIRTVLVGKYENLVQSCWKSRVR